MRYCCRADSARNDHPRDYAPGALKELASRAPGVGERLAPVRFGDTATLLSLPEGRARPLIRACHRAATGTPESVLTRAEEQIPDAERNLDALLASVEERQREQTRREADLEGREAQAEALRIQLESQATAQGAREAELRRKEKEAERTAREQSRSLLLEARQRVEDGYPPGPGSRRRGRVREARRLRRKRRGLRGENPLRWCRREGGRAAGSEDLGNRARGGRVVAPAGSELRDDAKAVVSAVQ